MRGGGGGVAGGGVDGRISWGNWMSERGVRRCEGLQQRLLS